MKLEDLKLYQECLDFEDKIWTIVDAWEGFKKETMGKSFVHASDAISSNIASGYGRYNFKDKKHYCYISRGYLLKTKGWVIKSRDRDMISDEQSVDLIENIEKIHRMLNAYIKSIGRRKKEHNNEESYNHNNQEEDFNLSSDNDYNSNQKTEDSYTTDGSEFFSSEMTN